MAAPADLHYCPTAGSIDPVGRTRIEFERADARLGELNTTLMSVDDQLATASAESKRLTTLLASLKAQIDADDLRPGTRDADCEDTIAAQG